LGASHGLKKRAREEREKREEESCLYRALVESQGRKRSSLSLAATLHSSFSPGVGRPPIATTTNLSAQRNRTQARLRARATINRDSESVGRLGENFRERRNMTGDVSELRMNVAALKRVDPYVKDILETATHVALYTFNGENNEWEKTDIEGALFVYSRIGEPYNSILIMNR
jgi:hypothetical protein